MSKTAVTVVLGLAFTGLTDTHTLFGRDNAAVALPTIESAVEGGTPFVGTVTISDVPRNIASISFWIEPKAGTVSAPMRATYSRRYLTTHDHFSDARTVVLPVFGLYERLTNDIRVTLTTNSGRKRVLETELDTSKWNNSCRNTLVRADRIVPANTGAQLDFSFFMLKAWACDAHPIVLDIDGNVRWSGTAGGGQQGSTFFRNNFYLGNGSDLLAITPFGDISTVGNYAEGGYSNFHHNIDPGKTGLLLEFDRHPDIESDVIEVATDGTILKEWDVAEIVRDAMIAGGDDPDDFVRRGEDWFHNNAATYWAAKNQLVLSGREDFVIGIGYDDHKIKWILGDPEKAWYSYESLREFALTLPDGTNPPIGQHAVSITSSGRLMLFDNGLQSFAHSPSGGSRAESVPRQYSLNLRQGTATEVWRYDHAPSVWSAICSSIYQHGSSYLIDYASEDGGIRLVGLDKRKNIGFELKITGSDISWGWNAFPFDFDRMRFR